MSRPDATRAALSAAIQQLGLQQRLRALPPHRYRAILQRILSQRTTLGVRGLERYWWWENLRPPVCSRTVYDPLATLASLIAPDEPLWLLAEAAAHKQVGSV